MKTLIVNAKTYSTATRQLFRAMFTSEETAGCSVNGDAKNSKRPLTPAKKNVLIGNGRANDPA